jgi:hypothetical protein
MIKHVFSNIKQFNLRFLKRGVGMHVHVHVRVTYKQTTSVSSLTSATDLYKSIIRRQINDVAP